MANILFLIHIPYNECSKLNKEIVRKVSTVDKPEEENIEESTENEVIKNAATVTTPDITLETGSEDGDNVDSTAVTEEESKPLIENENDETPASSNRLAPSVPSSMLTANAVQEPPKKHKSSKDHTNKFYNRYLSYDITEVVKNIIKDNKVERASWQRTDDEQFWQIMFPLESKNSDAMLNKFLTAGIGNNNYSSVSVLPITVNFPGMLFRDEVDETGSELAAEKNQFLQSVKSRLTVAQVIDVVRTGSQLTFDYIMLICMASLIAAVGLVENSSVLLVASMLVSPLMGPIMGGTFGIVLHYKPLWKPGILNELLGLALCLVAGFLFGIVCGFGIPTWGTITQEMSSRGTARSLYVGVIVAIPSGAGVALSILGGNAGSLVGVAISASLLPPAVNAGICWAFAIVSATREYTYATNSTVLQSKVTIEDYRPSELGEMGIMSLTLTLVNILVVFIMGVLILKVKEVAPNTGTAVTKTFWKRDLKTTREYLRGHAMDSGRKMGDIVISEWSQLNEIDLTNKETIKGEKAATIARELRRTIEALENEPSYNGVIRNLPGKASSGPNLKHIFNKLTPVQSRFNVTKAYNLEDTTFHSNSRFLINKLDETDRLMAGSDYNIAGDPELSSVHTVKPRSSTATKTVLLSVNKEDTAV